MDRPSNSATRGNDQVSVADSPSSVRTAQSTGQALLERIDRAWEEVVEQFTDLMELEQNGTPASSHKATGTPWARGGSAPSEPRHAAMRAAPVLPATPHRLASLDSRRLRPRDRIRGPSRPGNSCSTMFNPGWPTTRLPRPGRLANRSELPLRRPRCRSSSPVSGGNSRSIRLSNQASRPSHRARSSR